MDVLELLKNEDDNPRGQQGGRFVSGSTLEEVAAAEQRRVELRQQRWLRQGCVRARGRRRRRRAAAVCNFHVSTGRPPA